VQHNTEDTDLAFEHGTSQSTVVSGKNQKRKDRHRSDKEVNEEPERKQARLQTPSEETQRAAGLPTLMASDEQLPLNTMQFILRNAAEERKRFDEERKRFDEERKTLQNTFTTLQNTIDTLKNVVDELQRRFDEE